MVSLTVCANVLPVMLIFVPIAVAASSTDPRCKLEGRGVEGDYGPPALAPRGNA